MEIHKIKLGDNNYPEKLANIFDPPKVLYCMGDLSILDGERFAIVGTRRATRFGAEKAFEFAKKISRRGITIVSGLAFGIDAAAHRGGIEGCGGTIAVIAQDLGNIRPSSNVPLAMEIVKRGGLLISENPGKPVLAHDYLNRNRIISGLSAGVLVVEAAIRSGSLNTANHCLDDGGDLFAMPGKVTDEESRGCNNLLKNLACGASSAEDIFERMHWNYDMHSARNLEGRALELYKKILSSRSNKERLIKTMGPEILPSLCELEIQGLVKCSPRGRLSVVRK